MCVHSLLFKREECVVCDISALHGAIYRRNLMKPGALKMDNLDKKPALA